MEFVTGVKKKETLELSELLEEGRIGTEVKVNGAIHTIRDMGTIAFIILRKREGLVQCVYEENISKFDLKDVKEADTVEVTGVLTESAKAPNGIEIRLGELKILSEPAEPMPLPIAKWKLNTSLEAKLNYRPISLRNIRERAKFRIQEGIVRGFRDFLYKEGFTEIHTPKIGAKSAEGGANLFRLEYFHRPAILQQSTSTPGWARTGKYICFRMNRSTRRFPAQATCSRRSSPERSRAKSRSIARLRLPRNTRASLC